MNAHNNAVAIRPAQYNSLVEAFLEAEAALDAAQYHLDPNGYSAARAKRDEARMDLIVVLRDAPWGQNGNVFIDRRRAWIGGPFEKLLYIQGRLRATLDESDWIDVLTKENAEAFHHEEMEGRRHAEVKRQQDRDSCIRDLHLKCHCSLSSFGEWEYIEGMYDGVFRHNTTRAYVSARGALRGAWGDDWRENPAQARVEEEEWDRKIYGTRY